MTRFLQIKPLLRRPEHRPRRRPTASNAVNASRCAVATECCRCRPAPVSFSFLLSLVLLLVRAVVVVMASVVTNVLFV